MTKNAQVGLAFIILVLISIGGWFLLNRAEPGPVAPPPTPPVPEEQAPEPTAPTSTRSVIGSTVEGRDIEVYTFGNGETDLLFVGGIHGGYEWNSIALAYEMIDHLSESTSTVPSNITVHIIPNLNPDGLYEATKREGKIGYDSALGTSMHGSGLGRMNANDVDLNRNFDCKWAPTSTWRNEMVSAGTAPFSEPEAVALRDYVLATTPNAVVFWHSMANNVYASECENGVLPETLTLMNLYALSGGYGSVPVFDAYPVTGDAEGWLASIGIPAITVELGSRTGIEWSQNLAGVAALLDHYGK